MKIDKRIVYEFLLYKYNSTDKQVLFEKEVRVLFTEFRQWYKDNHWGTNPGGVTIKIFAGWLRGKGFQIVPPNRRVNAKL